MKPNAPRNMILAALMAALAAALTAYAHLPVPASNGAYVHLGDSAIYLAACLLPTPWAALAGAVGGGLADVLGGFASWAPATLAIKACMTLMFSAKRPTIFCGRNVLALLPAALINGAGYYLYESLLIKGSGWAGALANVPGNVIQSVGSAALFVMMALALDRLKIKGRMGL
ncbi:MAG: TIGR04002 family protein [Oscillospiraceae bacterium]|jgi:uncharacterized repeat protein (TIGR04002 family)|nr:TIGR04002 family protein [Oscillospiraceae bacterium]